MYPHDENGEEAGDQSEIAGPEVQQRFAQGGGVCSIGRDGRNFQLENQKGDGNGEDAVAEGFEAAGFFFALGVGLWLHGEAIRNWLQGSSGGEEFEASECCLNGFLE